MAAFIGIQARKAAQAFRKAMDTKGNDIGHLMTALVSLKTVICHSGCGCCGTRDRIPGPCCAAMTDGRFISIFHFPEAARGHAVLSAGRHGVMRRW
ncbi:MAG: hypothetical protein U0793_28985 [Gemmataceae bacterium]